MRKKVISLLLTLSIILGGLLPGMAWAETGSTWNPSGDIYKISTADDLVNFLNGLEKNGGYKDKTIQLETDINIDDSAVAYDSAAAYHLLHAGQDNWAFSVPGGHRTGWRHQKSSFKLEH